MKWQLCNTVARSVLLDGTVAICVHACHMLLLPNDNLPGSNGKGMPAAWGFVRDHSSQSTSETGSPVSRSSEGPISASSLQV